MADLGRPSSYKEEYNELAYKFCLLGATDAQLAEFFEVTEQTINNWKQRDPEFFESLKEEKRKADIIVADMLYKKALGGVKTTETTDGICPKTGDIIRTTKVKEHLPDTTSMIFWLKNRDPENWKEKVTNEIVNGEITVNIDKDDEKL